MLLGDHTSHSRKLLETGYMLFLTSCSHINLHELSHQINSKAITLKRNSTIQTTYLKNTI